MTTSVLHVASAGHAAVAAGPAALGGGGLAHFILRLFIWRAFWRLGMLIWHIKTFGPFVLLLIGAVLAAAAILRSRRGRRAGSGRPRYTGGGSSGGRRPRGW